MALQRRMRALPLSRITITDPFWSQWQQTLLAVTLPAQFAQLETSQRLENFRRAIRGEKGSFYGFIFNDSDVYKTIEAAAYALTSSGATAEQSKTLWAEINKCVELIEQAQEPSGYLNCHFQVNRPADKWRNLNTMHEMYVGGHLIEAAVALVEGHDYRRLLDVAVKWANHVMSIFGPEAGTSFSNWTGKRKGYCGHPEVELALIKLSVITGDDSYRAFAEWMVNERGTQPFVFEAELRDPEILAISPWGGNLLMANDAYDGKYAQDHAPVRDHREVVGHAVRAMYLYAAATDLADGKEDAAMEEALEAIWKNLTLRRMYVTGGIGPSRHNEGFTSDYDLPNLTAYAETCAACGLIFWGQRMLELSGNGDYADIIERALYNGALAGISVEGDKFFYDNPLESRGSHERTPWFECACCPANIARLIGSVGSYVASESNDAFFIHQYAGFEAKTSFNGVATTIKVASNFPWSGEVTIEVIPEKPVQFALNIRIPEWSEDVTTDLVDIDHEAGFDSGYAVFDRVWTAGDVLKVDVDVQPRWVEADPKVRENLGRVALTYGPLIYCAEEKDLGFAPQLFTVDVEAPITSEFKPKLLGGVQVLSSAGIYDVEQFVDSLYAPVGTADSEEGEAKFIPYYAWNNRGSNSMQVWVRRI